MTTGCQLTATGSIQFTEEILEINFLSVAGDLQEIKERIIIEQLKIITQTALKEIEERERHSS